MEKKSGKLLCLDLGTKKVGLAISDESLKFARDLKTVDRRFLSVELKKILEKERVFGFVVGLPLRKDGSECTASEKLRLTGKELADEFGLEVYFQDERLSSWDARSYLREMGYKPAKVLELEDQLAAKLILQSFLDSGLNSR